MDELQILIQAILSLKDTTKSKQQIQSELPKLESQLQADKSSRINIVAGLDIAKSKSLIQTQLNTLASQTNAPTINIGITAGNQSAVQSTITGLKNVQTQAQQTANAVQTQAQKIAKSIHDISVESSNFRFPVVSMTDKEGNTITDTVKTLENARNMFAQLGYSNVKFTWVDEAGGVFDKLTAKVTDLYGAVQNFKFELAQGSNNYTYAGSAGTDFGVEKLTASIQKAQDKVKALRINLTSELKSIRSAWQDVNGGKSVKSDENVEKLKQQYVKTAQAIRDLRNADDTTMTSMKANADAQIDKLNQMVSQYHNAEKVATQLRAKGFETVKIDTGNNINQFISSVNNSKVPLKAMQTEIDKLNSEFAKLDTYTSQADKSAGLTNVLNTLDNAKTKLLSLKELVKGIGSSNWLSANTIEQVNKLDDMKAKTAIYKENLNAVGKEWQSQCIYVDGIKNQVASLARSLPNIQKQGTLDKWLVQWSELNNKAVQLKANLDSQVNSQNRIYEIQSKIATLNPAKDGAEISRLSEKLQIEQKTLTNLQMQSNVYSDLISAEEREKYITEQTALSRDKLLSSTNSGTIKYIREINSAITELQRLQNSSTFTKNASNPNVTQIKQEISAIITEYQKLQTQLQGNITPAGLENVGTQLATLSTRFGQATGKARALDQELKNDNGAEKLAQRTALLTSQIEAYMSANPKAMKKYNAEFQSMLATLASKPDTTAVNQVQKQFQILRTEINKTNLAGKTLFQTFKEKLTKFTGWMSMTYAVSLAVRSVRNMITEVVDLDSALVDLKKTFGGTETDLKNLYISANDTAKELGVTTQEILEQASAWSRLGYSSSEAAETMAKNSAIFSTISPGMDINTATDGLVSMMKAFDIEANDVLDGILSKVNIVGNKFATDNESIVEAMTRSSAAMAEANNTLEQTVALNTASIEITRNAETTANAWRTVSMRLRGKQSLPPYKEIYMLCA